MKLLVTGSNGQLGSELRELSGSFPEHEFLFTDVAELDITNETAIREFFDANQPEVVINCAAYTAVDKAETDEKAAFLINATAPGNLGRVSAERGALLVHISTDYVFDGKSWIPYSESAEPGPASVYGHSKLAGEQEIIKLAKKAVIIRTSWLYSSYGNNFLKTVLKYGPERGKMNVVFDQTGSPTYAADLAGAILELIPKVLDQPGVEIFHYSDEGVCSWFDFATAIIELTGIRCRLSPILTSGYPLPAARPFYSVLNKQKIRTAFDLDIPYWRNSLIVCLKKMGYSL